MPAFLYNSERWLQPLKLAGVVAIFLFKIRHGGDGDEGVDSGVNNNGMHMNTI